MNELKSRLKYNLTRKGIKETAILCGTIIILVVAILFVLSSIRSNNQNNNGTPNFNEYPWNPLVTPTTISSIVHDPQKYLNTQVQIEGYLMSYVLSYDASANYEGIGELVDNSHSYYIWLAFVKNVTLPSGAINPLYLVVGTVGYYNSTEGVLPQDSYYLWVSYITFAN
jgi:hypothetical protein